MTKKWIREYDPYSIIDIGEDIAWALEHEDVIPKDCYENWNGKIIVTVEYMEDDDAKEETK